MEVNSDPNQQNNSENSNNYHRNSRSRYKIDKDNTSDMKTVDEHTNNNDHYNIGTYDTASNTSNKDTTPTKNHSHGSSFPPINDAYVTTDIGDVNHIYESSNNVNNSNTDTHNRPNQDRHSISNITTGS